MRPQRLLICNTKGCSYGMEWKLTWLKSGWDVDLCLQLCAGLSGIVPLIGSGLDVRQVQGLALLLRVVLVHDGEQHSDVQALSHQNEGDGVVSAGFGVLELDSWRLYGAGSLQSSKLLDDWPA